ncbi:unnamed protein product, partial [marine sediment metagenome]
ALTSERNQENFDEIRHVSFSQVGSQYALPHYLIEWSPERAT